MDVMKNLKLMIDVFKEIYLLQRQSELREKRFDFLCKYNCSEHTVMENSTVYL